MSAPGYDASEWAPGDVATWPGMGPVLCVPLEPWDLLRGATKWANKWGGYTFYSGPKVRRLVVIDPEDAEQVERLATLLWPHYAPNEHARLCKSEITAGALREFANPTPRIEEPQGLGAVVEDATGGRWVNAPDSLSDDTPWTSADNHGWCKWADVKAVRVLSEGVR